MVGQFPKRRLFTPGPLNTAATTKQAMMRDIGSREPEFVDILRDVRSRLVELAHASPNDGYYSIPIQGSGTFALESVFSSAFSPKNSLLIVVNGAYGRRLADMATLWAIDHMTIECASDEFPDLEVVKRALQKKHFSHIALVHCETSSGIVNPLSDIARLASEFGCRLIVDAMSSFGGIDINVVELGIDCLVTSANKCLEGVPGIAFAICSNRFINTCRGNGRTVCLDLYQQLDVLEQTGEFRFTPPTHVVLALQKALDRLDEEGGITLRHERYRSCAAKLWNGMTGLGFRPLLAPQRRSCIISAFHCPASDAFSFRRMYSHLLTKGFVVYAGKTPGVDCFRIGTIGQIAEEDILELVNEIGCFLSAAGFTLPLRPTELVQSG